ncbi:MAG: hypothetical protein SFV18_21245 [Bryobacteraceae bacterium]|nr:hypothetical protein [Bryobacteraceae bacterium]
MTSDEAIGFAQRLARERRTGEALDVLESALLDDPENSRIAKECARLSLEINELRAFTNWCHEALRIDPRDPEPHEMMSAVLRRIGRVEEAEHEARLAAGLR